MKSEIVPTPEATEWLVRGLRELAANLEDGLAESIHFEHYSETSATEKKYVARLEYRKIDPTVGAL